MGDQPEAKPLLPQYSEIDTNKGEYQCLHPDLNPRSQYPNGQDPRLKPSDQCDQPVQFILKKY
jgi:hypothetical protein